MCLRSYPIQYGKTNLHSGELLALHGLPKDLCYSSLYLDWATRLPDIHRSRRGLSWHNPRLDTPCLQSTVFDLSL